MTALEHTRGPAFEARPVGSSEEIGRLMAEGRIPGSHRGVFLFAYREEDDGGLRAVRLRHGLAGYRRRPVFERLNDDLHALAFAATGLDRIEYRLDLVGADGETTTVVDPLNGLAVEDPFGSKSFVLGPGYAEPRSIAPVPARPLRRVTLPGPGDDPWPAWLWTPTGPPPGAESPLLLFLDGSDYVDFSAAVQVLTNLVSWGAIPRCRAVFLRPAHRDDEYSANPALPGYLAKDLPAALRRHMPVPTRPERRLAIGASLGALALLHAHWRTEAFFGGLVLQSGSFFVPETDGVESKFTHFERITEFVQEVRSNAGKALPIPICLTRSLGGENLSNNRAMAATLAERGFPVRSIEVADAHNWTAWRNCLGEAVVALFELLGEEE